jgi:lycopene beta-cyclase
MAHICASNAIFCGRHVGDELITYDVIIAGGGLSGLLVARELLDHPGFNGSIAIFEADTHKSNDRTWCFWESGKGEWDQLLEHQWRVVQVIEGDRIADIPLRDYAYKMLRSGAFYNELRNKLKQFDKVDFFNQRITHFQEKDKFVFVETDEGAWRAGHLFNSMAEAIPNQHSENRPDLMQHFSGWFVRTSLPVFDADKACLMNFNVKQADGVCFMYVLPTTSREALVEFTVFGPTPWAEEDYQIHLQEFMAKLDTRYEILERENGVIPMTVYPWSKKNTALVTRIGTAGGWTRPSTGFTFFNSQKFAAQVVQDIMNQKIGRRPFSSKHYFYDEVMLTFLKNYPKDGPAFFFQMYRAQPIERIFRFLDGTSSLAQDVLILANTRPFLRFLKLGLAWMSKRLF